MVFVVSFGTFFWVSVLCLMSMFVFRDREPRYTYKSRELPKLESPMGLGPVMLVGAALLCSILVIAIAWK